MNQGELEQAKALRREYGILHLTEDNAGADPFVLLKKWWDEAVAFPVAMPDAVTLATVDDQGIPDARVVLLKYFNETGCVFFTNYTSSKARQLASHPHACLLMWWPQLERQVRIRGNVQKIATEESDAYFESRPRGAQLAACASEQSAPIIDRAALEARVQAVAATYEGKPVPRPKQWGGFLLQPISLEFWQGRADRLHDRFFYHRTSSAGWTRERLMP